MPRSLSTSPSKAAGSAATAPSKPPDVTVPGDGSGTDSPRDDRDEPPRSLDERLATAPRSLEPDAPVASASPGNAIYGDAISPAARASSCGAGLKQRRPSLQMLQRSYTAATAFVPSPGLGNYAQVPAGSGAAENPLEV